MLQVGTPEITTAFPVELEKIFAQDVASTLRGYRNLGHVFLLGSAYVVNASSSSPTLSLPGNQVIFHSATLETNQSSGIKILCDVSLSILVRHDLEKRILEINYKETKQVPL